MDENYIKIEKGKQIGIRKKILKENKYYWYSFAIQKANNKHIVYEHEIGEENIFREIDEFENIYLFLKIPCKQKMYYCLHYLVQPF